MGLGKAIVSSWKLAEVTLVRCRRNLGTGCVILGRGGQSEAEVRRMLCV